MADLWSEMAREVSDEWIADGRLDASANHLGGGDLEFWNEVERRVKLAEADAGGQDERPSRPQS